MRCVDEPDRSRPWGRLAVFAAIAVAAAGCSSDTDRFDNPFASRQPQSSGEVTGSVSQPRASNVQSQPLPPPSAANVRPPATRPASTGVSGGSAGMGSFNPGRPQSDITGSVPPQTVAAAPARPAWNWEGGTPVTAAQGDTADTLSRRYGVPAAAIVQANNLSSGTAIRPGQRLVIPRYETTGSVAAQRPTQPRPSAPGAVNHVHVIAPGETLMKLTRQYNRSLSEIANANNIPPHTMVKVGDRIVIPGVRVTQQAAAPRIPAATAQPKRPVAAQPQPPKVAAVQTTVPSPTTARLLTPADPEPAPAATPKQDAKAETKPDAATSSTSPTFRWPVRGRVILGFGPKTGGQRNDGINVSVPEGTPIRAAEDGVVAYAGNELKAYGNLVLVRHANGYVTAYAHASEILVKRDDRVKRGQVIARAGQTGNVATAQLHFEIRKGSTPIDPIPYLERGGSS
jgi:murein DD-endopeptidase MepM/ murein hydrolase activator NlpD